MVCLQTKNPNLGKFLRTLEWKMLFYFMTIWNIFTAIWYNVWPFGIVCGHLVYFPRFGMFGSRKIWQPLIFQLHLGKDFLRFIDQEII
jgi:hypothetical protein